VVVVELVAQHRRQLLQPAMVGLAEPQRFLESQRFLVAEVGEDSTTKQPAKPRAVRVVVERECTEPDPPLRLFKMELQTQAEVEVEVDLHSLLQALVVMVAQG
jgi:hypothetical protein